MGALNRLFARVRNLVMRRRNDERLREEMEAHIANLTDENMHAGMGAGEARRQAILKFGAYEAIRESYHSEANLPLLESVQRNVRYALRLLRRSPGFAVTAVLALALGIGPNVAIFSIIWATFLAPLPFPKAHELVVVWRHYKGERIPTGGAEYAELAAESRSFQSLSFQSWLPVHLTNADHTADQEAGLPTSPGMETRTVRQPLLMGRDFLPDEGGPGQDRVVILTNWIWQHRYYADPSILGKSILIEDKPYTVIGVMRAGPHERAGGIQFFTPVLLRSGVETPQFGIMIGRLNPGVTLAQAQAELSVIDQRYATHHFAGVDSSSLSLTVEHFRNDWLDVKTQRNLWLMLDAVGLVLLIACANLANLLLARGAARTQELAVRTALGATRRQIFGQLLTESLTLAVLGAAAGIAMGWAIMKLSVILLPNLALEATDVSVEMNLPVLGFAALIALIAGVLAGCAPGWRSVRISQIDSLKQGLRSTGKGRTVMQSMLVSAEIALALVLLAGAGMALHSFWNLTHIDVGFKAERVVTAMLRAQNNGVGRASKTSEQLIEQERVLLERVRQIPGVVDAGLATELPMHSFNSAPIIVVGQPLDRAHMPTADLQAVTPSFFQTFGIRLLRGRFLTDSDVAHAPTVVMVNEAFVRHYLRDEDPLTSRLQFGFAITVKDAKGRPRTVPPPTLQVVGVFHDVLNNQHLTGEVQPAIYLSAWQSPMPTGGSIAVRTVADDPLTITNALQRAVSTVEPGTAIDHVETMEQVMEQEWSSDRAEMLLFGAFAAVALLLASIGIYGVMSFAVAQRTHEIGVRMALGARRREVIRLILADGMRMALLGLAVGLAGALGLGRLMHSTLYGVKSVDLLTLTGVAVLLFGVALLACWAPARRSAAVDPMRALRNE